MHIHPLLVSRLRHFLKIFLGSHPALSLCWALPGCLLLNLLVKSTLPCCEFQQANCWHRFSGFLCWIITWKDTTQLDLIISKDTVSPGVLQLETDSQSWSHRPDTGVFSSSCLSAALAAPTACQAGSHCSRSPQGHPQRHPASSLHGKKLYFLTEFEKFTQELGNINWKCLGAPTGELHNPPTLRSGVIQISLTQTSLAFAHGWENPQNCDGIIWRKTLKDTKGPQWVLWS